MYLDPWFQRSVRTTRYFFGQRADGSCQGPILKEALRCIKCGACLFECPVFELAAGYYGGRGYFGGLGAILTAYMGEGFDIAAPIAYTCLRCGRCTEVCPQSIDLSKLMPELRHRIVNMAKR